MLFKEYGEASGQVIVMLAGSFCAGECLDYLYSKLDGYRIIVPTYNGHYEGSKDFTSRAGEASEICAHLAGLNITDIQMIYGQSMGAEVGMELYRQLAVAGIAVHCLFFDGAPMIKLSPVYKVFMKFKFSSMIRMFEGKTADEAMEAPIVKKIVGAKAEQLRPMIEAVCQTASYLSAQSIKNVTECCYTFDYPPLSEEMQARTTFFYGSEEKAYKTCYELVHQAYPKANYIIEQDQGHVTYSCECTDDYIELLKDALDPDSLA